jgi:hypothetical protein
MTSTEVRAGAGWLALREPADAAARSAELVAELRRGLPVARRLTVHDLGCGSGSMARWLAPRLPGPQHWVLHDRDPELLPLAAAAPPHVAADGGPVSVETRRGDITRLGTQALADADLVTTSALLDMLTAEELDRLVETCDAPGCPVLLTLSVVGQVELTPADPLDPVVAAAFNDHQRRCLDEHPLLGPDAVEAAAQRFGRHGRDVLARPSPWRLGPGDRALAEEWFVGWWTAACEQRPGLAASGTAYARRRRAQARAGRLRATVHHQDLLVRRR